MKNIVNFIIYDLLFNNTRVKADTFLVTETTRDF